MAVQTDIEKEELESGSTFEQQATGYKGSSSSEAADDSTSPVPNNTDEQQAEKSRKNQEQERAEAAEEAKNGTGYRAASPEDEEWSMSWLKYRMHGVIQCAGEGKMGLPGKQGAPITDKQLRIAIIGLVKQYGNDTLYGYRGNQIDPQTTQRMRQMVQQMTAPGGILEGRNVKVSDEPMSKNGTIEPWRKVSWTKPWRAVGHGAFKVGQKINNLKTGINKKALEGKTIAKPFVSTDVKSTIKESIKNKEIDDAGRERGLKRSKTEIKKEACAEARMAIEQEEARKKALKGNFDEQAKGEAPTEPDGNLAKQNFNPAAEGTAAEQAAAQHAAAESSNEEQNHAATGGPAAAGGGR